MRKVGQKLAIGRGNRGQCDGCEKPWRHRQRVTLVSDGHGAGQKVWQLCDTCVRNTTPPIRGVELAKPSLFGNGGLETRERQAGDRRMDTGGDGPPASGLKPTACPPEVRP